MKIAHPNRDSCFANQLIRHEAANDTGKLSQWLNCSLDTLQLQCSQWLTAQQMLLQYLTEPGQLVASQDELATLQAQCDSALASISSKTSRSQAWQVLELMHRYAIQGDGRQMQEIMQMPEQGYLLYRIELVMKLLEQVQTCWYEMPPFCDVENMGDHTAPGILLALRFVARCKLDFPAQLDSALISGLSSYFELPAAGLGLTELAALSKTSYGRIKSLTASHNRDRSGLHTIQAAGGAYISIETARRWLLQEPGFQPSHGIAPLTQSFQAEKPTEIMAENENSLILISDGQRLNIDEAALIEQASQLSEQKFARNFCLIDKQGTLLFPVRMSKRGSSEKYLRLSAGGGGGNLVENSIEEADATIAMRMVVEQGMAIRVSAIESNKSGLYKLNSRSIMAAYDIERKKVIWGNAR